MLRSLVPAVAMALLAALPGLAWAKKPAPAISSEARWKVSLEGAAQPAGMAQRLRVVVKDHRGRAVGKVADSHGAPMHVFAFSEDLAELVHLHPERKRGAFEAAWTPPRAGRYVVWAQFHPEGGAPQSVSTELRVPGEAPPPFDPARDRATSRSNGHELVVWRKADTAPRSGPLTLRFDVRQAGTGAALHDFEEIAGVRAHLVAVKVGAPERVLVHAHAHEEAKHHETEWHGENPHAGPSDQARYRPQASTPEGQLAFDVTFPEPGTYRFWVQYRRQGRDAQHAFTIDVNEGAAK
ncbi:MAG: hypothetical protein ACK4N5_01080 [Myxococcales bacterium]